MIVDDNTLIYLGDRWNMSIKYGLLRNCKKIYIEDKHVCIEIDDYDTITSVDTRNVRSEFHRICMMREGIFDKETTKTVFAYAEESVKSIVLDNDYTFYEVSYLNYLLHTVNKKPYMALTVKYDGEHNNFDVTMKYNQYFDVDSNIPPYKRDMEDDDLKMMYLSEKLLSRITNGDNDE